MGWFGYGPYEGDDVGVQADKILARAMKSDMLKKPKNLDTSRLDFVKYKVKTFGSQNFIAPFSEDIITFVWTKNAAKAFKKEADAYLEMCLLKEASLETVRHYDEEIWPLVSTAQRLSVKLKKSTISKLFECYKLRTKREQSWDSPAARNKRIKEIVDRV